MRLTNRLHAVPSLVAAGVLAWTAAAGAQSAPGFGEPLEGITMDQWSRFFEGQDEFEAVEDADDGLGPTFNGRSCAECHGVPAVGGSSPINETRAQRVVGGVRSELPGGSLFQSDATSPGCAETVPPEANVVALRQSTPLFGSGLIEAIPDRSIQARARWERRAHPQQAGRVHVVVDVASGRRRAGRFGWKSQQATLLSFAADAYVNEMGITSRLFPVENAPNGDLARLATCDAAPDPEDEDEDFVAFADFMRLLAPPPGADRRAGDLPRARRGRNGRGERGRGGSPGRRLFDEVGCVFCHYDGYRAQSSIRAINGRRVEAFSDFLLHDVGTGDGIEQGGARPNELRTAPLWGLAESAPYLHDGSAPTIEEAIRRHGNQGAAARDAFDGLSQFDQETLLSFLESI
jgi:CxxC motif-containing protein (DUF1111 family)